MQCYLTDEKFQIWNSEIAEAMITFIVVHRQNDEYFSKGNM